MWIEHRPANPVPLGTVLQPHIKRRKSVTKLTSVKDITNNKQCKYLLIDQGEDEVGDLETKLYKVRYLYILYPFIPNDLYTVQPR